MNSSVDEHKNEHKCGHCDYKSTRPYNLKRHMVTKHVHINVDNSHINVDTLHTNVDNSHINVDRLHTNVDRVHTNVDSLHTNVDNRKFTCNKCNKTFKYKWFLDRHTTSCLTKIDAKTCEYCNRVFSDRSARHRHHKICKVRIEKDSMALVVNHVTPESSIPSAVINSHNTTTTTNVQNQINNNNNNNTVINLVVYNSNPNETMSFNHDHIDPKKLKKFLVPGDKVLPERLTDVVREWTQQLFANDNNKCVKKTNIRASHSQVHVGNNTWESRLDKELYPHLMNNIANDFSFFFNDNYRRTMYKALDAFIDYMASDGYCSTDSDNVIMNSYKTLVKELKLRMFDITKRE